MYLQETLKEVNTLKTTDKWCGRGGTEDWKLSNVSHLAASYVKYSTHVTLNSFLAVSEQMREERSHFVHPGLRQSEQHRTMGACMYRRHQEMCFWRNMYGGYVIIVEKCGVYDIKASR